MSSRIEIWSGNGSTERVILELPEAVARAIASQPGNRWIDDFVAAVAELRPGGYEGALELLAENLPRAIVTFHLTDTFPGDPPVELVRWLDDRAGMREIVKLANKPSAVAAPQPEADTALTTPVGLHTRQRPGPRVPTRRALH
jgi:hypothetical protein